MGGLIILLGLVLGLRVLIHYFNTVMVNPYVPSAILTAVLLIVGFQVIILALITDMIGSNCKVQEEILYMLKKKTRKDEQQCY